MSGMRDYVSGIHRDFLPFVTSMTNEELGQLVFAQICASTGKKIPRLRGKVLELFNAHVAQKERFEALSAEKSKSGREGAEKRYGKNYKIGNPITLLPSQETEGAMASSSIPIAQPLHEKVPPLPEKVPPLPDTEAEAETETILTETETETETRGRATGSASVDLRQISDSDSASAWGSVWNGISRTDLGDRFVEPVTQCLRLCGVSGKQNENSFRKQLRRIGEQRFRTEMERFWEECNAGEVPRNKAAAMMARLKKINGGGTK